ncbi:hypothetical protein [Manganibacter manganicus]|uniref:Uncharacterized protein n=1 Tax=Manganibacter manganicus TaxID=1873176 RepID=A0A1V8RTU6_9HYPH|nr:hypothetical protein [Pseudaminobacter manganicus]OQM76612.1 hypothetical protein BFN67_13340 [Pseudaminobacter manganicus]
MSETTSKLDELLGDPMVQLVMERDRVEPTELRLMLERAAQPMLAVEAEEPAVPPAHVIAESRCPNWLCR